MVLGGMLRTTSRNGGDPFDSEKIGCHGPRVCVLWRCEQGERDGGRRTGLTTDETGSVLKGTGA